MGRPVVSLNFRFGGYSTDLNIDARYVRRLPEDWDFQQGAGFLTQCLTAW